MQLTPTSFAELSNLKYTVSLPKAIGQDVYPFVHVAFSGRYGDGNDAKFILATMAAVQVAWFSMTIIIDLIDFGYTWGDEMEWIYGIGYDTDLRMRKKLVIIVGSGCCAALESLDPEAYEEYCVGTLDAALQVVEANRDCG